MLCYGVNKCMPRLLKESAFFLILYELSSVLDPYYSALLFDFYVSIYPLSLYS